VVFTVNRAPLGMADDDETRAAIAQHVRGNLAGERTRFLIRTVLRAGVGEFCRDFFQVNERRSDDDIRVLHRIEIRRDPFRRDVHLPVGDELAVWHCARVYRATERWRPRRLARRRPAPAFCNAEEDATYISVYVAARRRQASRRGRQRSGCVATLTMTASLNTGSSPTASPRTAVRRRGG